MSSRNVIAATALATTLVTGAAALAVPAAIAQAAEAAGVDAAAVAQAVGAEFTYKDVLGEAVITGYTGTGGRVEIPSTLGLLPVTGIAEGAFSQNHAVTEVVVPEGVTSIGDYAFNDCTSLASVSLPSTLKTIGKSAFYTCGALTKVDLPAGLTSIGDYAFFGCISLTSVSIPGTVQEWGAASFAYNYKLEKVTIGAGVAEVPERAFRDCRDLSAVEMPASVKTVGRRAFQGCIALATCDLSHVETFGYAAFAGNASGNLTTLNLASAKKIEGKAFASQSQVTELLLPSVEYIGADAFSGALSSSASIELTLPASLATLEDGALAKTSDGLKRVNVAEGCSAYKSIDGVVYSADGTELVCVPAGYTTAGKVFSVPEQVTKIAASAFGGVKGLEKVVMGNGVTELGEGAFSNCDAKSVVLSAGLSELPARAFEGSGVESIDVPASVKSIGESAFASCKSLTSLTLHEGLESVGALAFSTIDELPTLKLPSTLTSIDPSAFNYLRSCEVSLAEGGAYSMKDGMLLADEGSKLVMVFSAAVKDGCVTIPDGVTTIGSLAFGEVSGTCDVRVPDSVAMIEEKGLACSFGDGSNKVCRDRVLYGTADNQALIDYANENCLPVFSQDTPVLSATSLELAAGQTADLTATGILSRVAWVSSDNSVASVDSAGHVTAKAGGEADIFAVAGEKYFSAHVKVSGDAATDPYAGYARVTSSTDATSWFAADAEYNKPLTSSSSELSGIYLYSSENYSGVNAFLEPLGFKAMADEQYGEGEYGEFEGVGQNAASELGQFKIHENVVVYSGLEDAEFIEGSGVDVADVAAMAGKEITVKPVLSTSLLPGVADRFRKVTAEKIMLEIYLPKDSTQGACLGGASVVVDEQEVTFAPGTKFYVLDAGVRYADSYGFEPDQVVGTAPQRFLKLVPVVDDDPTPTPDPEPTPDPTPQPSEDGSGQGGNADQAGDTAEQGASASTKSKSGKGSTPSTGDVSTGYVAGAAAGLVALVAALLKRAGVSR